MIGELRQQYYFKKSGEDTYIWDVHRLIELSKDLEVITQPLDKIIELDTAYWFGGDEGKPATCKAIAEHAKLINAADLDYPIILSSDGSVMDGMHRVTKAYMLGHSHIKAVQFEQDPKHDYKNIDENDLQY